jgi:hypothetical protein
MDEEFVRIGIMRCGEMTSGKGFLFRLLFVLG